MGGMQKHTWFLARHLARKGVDVTIYHGVQEGQKLINHLEGFDHEMERTVKHRCFHFPRPGKIPGHYLREPYRYSTELKRAYFQEKEAFDFIYIQGFAGWALLEARKKGKKFPPIGINFHGLEMFQLAAGWKSKLEQYLFKGPVTYNLQLADTVYSLGGKLTKLIEGTGIPLQKIKEISIGLEEEWLKKPQQKERKTTHFVFVGRYERRKGVEELNQVVEQLALAGEEFEMHYIGPIPPSKRKVLPSKVKAKVHYHGAIKEQERMRELLDQADVLVSPSWSEGMPTVILEAMARGLAVIATDVGAVAEEVDATNGLLIPPGDSVALKKAIETMIAANDAKLFNLKLAGYNKVKDTFLWPRIAKLTLDHIQTLTGTEATSADADQL